MKKFLFLFTLLSAFCFGQEVSLKEKKDIHPLYILDGKISNEAQMKLLQSKDISSVSVYKSDRLPENLQAFSNFALEGIIEISLKEKSENSAAFSLAFFNKKNNLDEINAVYINGILVKDTAVKIEEDAIEAIEIIENNDQKFLNIWTVSQEERNGITQKIGGIKYQTNDLQTMKTVILK
ncbi:MAG: hypothetical protein ACOH1X_01525 [Kaistella sp.]